MANETDGLIEQRVTPNVVPESLTPRPLHEQTFQQEPTAELRSQQQRVARGYVVGRIDAVQLTIQKNKRQVGSEIVHFTPPELEAQKDLAYTYQVVQTKMAESLADFAGATPIDVLEANLPEIFERFVDLVLRERFPEAYPAPTELVAADDAPAVADEPVTNTPEELEVISPPVPVRTLEEAIDGVEDVSPLEIPEDEISLVDVLSKITSDNSAD